jgi:hypothetical protein
MSKKGRSVLQNEELDKGFSGNNNSDNDSRPAERQASGVEFWEKMSWLRQKFELGFGVDLDSPA